MKTSKKLIYVLFLLIVWLSSLIAFSKINTKEPILVINSYRDVPEITATEIEAIERIKADRESFIYGMISSTESFIDVEGNVKGASVYMIEWLSKLFDIPFELELFTLDELSKKLARGDIDFTGYFMNIPERHETFFMTNAISLRPVNYFRLVDSRPLSEIRERRTPRYALIEGSATAKTIRANANYEFKAVYVKDPIDAYKLLRTGKVDAFVGPAIMETTFENIQNITTEYFLPLIYSSSSISTQNEDLAAFISVIEKALNANERTRVNDFYKKGYQDFLKNKLLLKLSDAERQYIKDNKVIPYVANFDNYPINFYNHRAKEWQGVGIDVIREIERLTDLKFEIVNSTTATFPEVIQKLEDGVGYVLPHVIRTPSREGRFLWPDTPIMIDTPVLISKIELPNVSINDVYFMTVGLTRNTAYTELFQRWFPGHAYTKKYDGYDEALNALDRGEVDLVMDTYNGILYLAHYLEKPGFKANIMFDYSLETNFGINIDQPELASIIDKSFDLIDLRIISNQWLYKNFDYRASLIEAQIPWIIGVSILILFSTSLTILVYRRKREKEEILAISRTKLMLDSIPLCCVLIDKNFNGIDCNKEALRMFEFDKKKLLLDNIFELFPERQPNGKKSVHYIKGLLRKSFEEGELVREIMHQTLDGTPIPALVMMERIPYEDDYVILVSLQDLREHKRMSSRIEAMISNLPGVVYQSSFRKDHSAVIYVSEGCKDLTGYDQTELLGTEGLKRFRSMIPEVNMKDNLERYKQTLLQGLPFELSYRLIAKDGSTKWVLERCRVTEFDKDGNPAICEGYIMDITEKRKLEEAEEEYERLSSRLAGIVDNLPGAAYQRIIKAPNNPFTFFSKGSEELFGFKPEEIIDNKDFNVGDFIPPEDLEGLVEEQKRCYEEIFKGETSEITYRVVLKDGTEKWLWERAYLAGTTPDGKYQVVEGYVTDVTEQKRVETAELASKAKSEFLAVMSHEIRTPMNSMLGFAELALDSNNVTPQVKTYLTKIQDNTKWLLSILNDALDISKIESGKMQLEKIPFDLDDVISRCQSIILPSVQDKDLELQVRVEPIIGRRLVGDPVRLYQVLSNLLSNAVKFTDEGSVKLFVAIKEQTENDVTIYFEVKDTGIGMTAKQIKEVLKPFVQAEVEIARNYGGTGLGLAIVKNIVELMGGEAKVKSKPGVGSSFSFELTFDTTDAFEDDYVPEGTLEKPTYDGLVLVVDDNHMNQEVMCGYLDNVGLKYDVADNGKIALDMVEKRVNNKEKPYDVIFMDMFMPVMDGIESTKKIRNLEVVTPIVAVTANVMSSELIKYKKVGIQDCLNKPYSSQELWKILSKHLAPPKKIEIEEVEDKFLEKLRTSFIKNNKNKFTEIMEAIDQKDLVVAHRLVHSLKGNAGFIHKNKLQNMAAEMEELLLNNEYPSTKQLKALDKELTSVLSELDRRKKSQDRRDRRQQ